MNLLRWSRTVAAVLLSACGATSREHGESFPDDDARRREASTVAEEWVSAPDADLSSFSQLAVDSRGNTYVPDFYRNRVVVFDAGGRLLRTLGRRGSGPGEFQAIRTVQVIRGDSLLVYDGGLGRISVFARGSDREAYVVTLREAPPWALERTRAGDAYLARYEPMFQFGPGAVPGARVDRIRALNMDGSRRGDLLAFPARSFIVAEQSIMPNPWGHSGFVRLDSKDRLHFAWSDTLGIATYDLVGQRVGGFRVDYTPPPTTRAELDQALAEVPDAVRPQFARALEDSFPSRWPAVNGLLVDDQDRVWLEVAGPRGREVEWAGFTPAGAYVGSLLLPAGTSAYHIRGASILAKKEDEDGAPRLVLYRMVRPPR